MAYEDDYTARRRAAANARREASSHMQPTRVSGGAAEARRAAALDLERSSAARRDARTDYHAEEHVSVRRAAGGEAVPSVNARAELTTHRAERSAMSTPIPRGGQRSAEGYQLYEGYSEPDAPAERPMPQAQPFVRRERPRRTQAAINDMEADELYAEKNFSHDSPITVGRGSIFSTTGRAYRRSSKQLPQLRSSHGYGRYLSVPKGRGSLFNMEQQRRRRNTAFAIGAAVIILILLFFVVRAFSS